MHPEDNAANADSSARPSRQRPPAILFDLDGTLIDSIELIVSSMRSAFEGRDGPAPTREEWVAGIGTPLRTQLRSFARDDADLETIVEAYRAYQREHHDRLMRCYDDVVETIRLLHARGHPLGIVTSKAEDLMRRSLEFVGLASMMSVSVGLDSCTKHKPDPEPLHIALAALGYAPSEALFVGDSVHDMQAGRAAGVTTVAVLWGTSSREQLARAEPDYWLEKISELPRLVQQAVTRD